MVTIIQKKIHGHTEVLGDMVARLVESLATGSMAGTFLYEISLICLLLIYGCNTCRVDILATEAQEYATVFMIRIMKHKRRT